MSANPTLSVPSNVLPIEIMSSLVPSPKVNVLGVFNFLAISTLASAKLISTLDAAVILPLASTVTIPT